MVERIRRRRDLGERDVSGRLIQAFDRAGATRRAF
jgi:hypothetical protein